MGVFEMAKFEVGTKGIMDAVVAATKAGASSIIGKLTFRGLSLAIPNGLTVAQKAVVYIQDTCFNSFANITIKCHLLPIIHPFTVNYSKNKPNPDNWSGRSCVWLHWAVFS